MVFKIIFPALAYFICCGLDFYDASAFYGSNILICSEAKEGRKTLRYWSLVKKYSKKKNEPPLDLIVDLLSKKTYKLGECVPFECSPEPWRLKDCRLK